MKLSIRTKLIMLLFFLVFIAVALVSGQSYRISMKDMSNNAKANTHTYAKNISDVIQERLDAIKEKALMAEMNENLMRSSSSVIFERSPELLAVTKYFFATPYSQPEEQNFLLNPSYKEKKGISRDNFSGLEKAIDFPSVFKNNEFLNMSKLPNYSNDVIIYSFPVKATGDQGLYVFVSVLSPDLVSGAGSHGNSKYINYLVDDKGRILVHPDKTQLTKNIRDLAIFKDFFTTDVISEKTSEYTDENDQKVIGSIFKIKRSNIGVVSKILAVDAYSEAQKLKNVFIITTLFAFAVSIVIGLYFAGTLSAPILKLAKITGEIARGNFLVNVDIKSKDEIGELASDFSKMGHELYDREQELNTAHSALIQSEKMSAFGQISAGIAHEVKNPLTGILGHTQLTKEKIARIYGNNIPPDVDNSLNIIEKETKRCKLIIENLMKFSRQEKTQFVEEDISSVVRGGIALVDHQLTIGGVKIERNIPDGFPKIMCSANQIEQVLMNIMLNAQHAMENSAQKRLTVRVKQGRAGYARIEISDTGTGMSMEVKKRIFEPFFTTKASGKGTGLGLSVSYGIVKDHKGILDVESKEGEGTTFIIELPYKDAEMVADVNKLTEHKEEVSVHKEEIHIPIPSIVRSEPTAPTQSVILPPPPQGPPPPSQPYSQTHLQQTPIQQTQASAIPPKLKSKISCVLESKLESGPKSDKKSIGPISIPRPQRRG